nr:hypothetical protein [uncultured Mucilaginibacter sp.]
MNKFSLLLIACFLLGKVVLAQQTPATDADTSGYPGQNFRMLGHGGTLDSARHAQLLEFLNEATGKKQKKGRLLVIIPLSAVDSSYCNMANCHTDECRKEWVTQLVKKLGGKRKVSLFMLQTSERNDESIINERFGFPVYQFITGKLFRLFFRTFAPACIGVTIVNKDGKFTVNYDSSINLLPLQKATDAMVKWHDSFIKQLK